jgi:large subunit ribosomal protein L35
MPKLKSHRALLKRVRITGRGKVKFHKANSSHLLSHKSGDKRRKLRKTNCAKASDIKRLSRMLHMPLTASDKDR